MTNKNLTQKTFEFMEEPKKKTHKLRNIVLGLTVSSALASGGFGCYLNYLRNQVGEVSSALVDKGFGGAGLIIGRGFYALTFGGAIQAFEGDLEGFDKKMKHRQIYGDEYSDELKYNSTDK